MTDFHDQLEALKKLITHMTNKDTKDEEVPAGLWEEAGVEPGTRLKDIEKTVADIKKKVGHQKKEEEIAEEFGDDIMEKFRESGLSITEFKKLGLHLKPNTVNLDAEEVEDLDLGDDEETDEPFSPTIEGNHSIHHKRNNNDDDEDDTTLTRVDSLAFTSRLVGEVRSVDSVVMDTAHVPREDQTRFYESIEPARGKYLELIKQLMDQKTQEHLDDDLARALCDDMEAVLETEETLLDVKISDDDTLVVVGDVHGQFSDLVAHILSQQYDRPEGTPERKFLFLGDFVDRGPNGVEVIMLLFALKVEYPSMIFLTRGNHEDPQTSRIYGFLFEVKQKFDNIAVWARFNEVFVCLPLAALVAAPCQTIFAAHGGLSPQLTDLHSLRTLARREYGTSIDANLESIVDGLLWSDPTDETDDFEHNDRGCGYVFGTDATKAFCEDNNIDFICRAHQLTSEGYCFTHEDKCLTVFSAPNYCGVNGNKGAIMLVDKEGFRFVQFDSVAKNTRTLPMNFGSMFGYFS